MRPTGTPSVMVGRGAELRSLLDAFDDGRRGRPRAVLVRGEAGIGKTRLVQELLAQAAARRDEGLPLVVAVGQCVDLGPIGAPFGPIRRVLRDLHGEVGTDALREAAGSPAAVTALAALVPGLAPDAPADDEQAGEFAEAIEVVLESLSATRHVVIVIEDLQWADAATFALLKTLASTLRGRHLTIISTYRSDDIDRFHPLHPVLAELDRTPGLVRVDLEPLSLAEVAEQVSILTADGIDPQGVERLAERSGGIPFLVEELVDLGDRGLPDTLRDLVLARYTRLSDPAQETVRAMAAGGMHVDHDVLAAVSMLDDRTLDRALREAIDTRVVLAAGAGYSFRHALTREAVHGEMLPSERVRVHRAFAEYLQQNRPADSPDDVSAVAEHWLAARDLTAAFDATVRALRLSRASFAPATSVKLAERLTELWDQVPDAEARAGTSRPVLHLEAAQAWHDLGDAHRALRSANEGLAVCVDDPLTRAALLRQRFVEVFNAEHRERREDLEEAVRLLEGIDSTPAKALMSRAMSNLAISEHGREAADHASRAIELAEAAGDDAALAVALTIEGWRVSGDEDDQPAALRPLERAVALKLDPPLRAYAGSAHVDQLSRLGRFAEAAAVAERYYAEAVRAGIERGSGTSIAHGLAFALFAVGRPDDALAYATRARRLSDKASRTSAVRMTATHLAWNDEAAARAELLASERGSIDETKRLKPEKGAWWHLDKADAALEFTVGRPSPEADARRREALAGALEVVESDMEPATRRYAAVAASLLVASAPDEHGEERERLLRALDDWADHEINRRWGDYVRAALGDTGPAAERVARWRAVAAAPAGGGLLIWHVQVARLRLAEALIANGERDEAAHMLERILDEAPPQGVARVARWAKELGAHARLLGGADAAAASGAIAGLTPRELQVLELVADGLTNSEIGRRLFISPKTASVHVSAILAKVGAANRAEAAAIFAASSPSAS
ncbi:helix-turn-helix transcriptional regulator [Microbacterium immunditiarum]|uniref:DNA-binding CsgD family transcriptional regulator/predicted negative regulator of RcsB-dependent stress response n=1 Tax=Microbacterium immunditiarum TaxID=337480 RepID=A0A7Y9GRE3_9MICO|nr:LuxR family transcriptional regulator [Microbacterium immunditiarum]NYE21226.1 DNA-binding CsgD family transcriptional regulator/predicted negative regulator of RcsB-dependent stress response [Microbacterium immunditiarum]